MDSPILTPRRPHLLRAFYDWLVENDLTPHLVVDATLPFVDVPEDYVQDGQIVLNVAPRAIADLVIENDKLSFNARFAGQPTTVVVPIYAVMAIYARENGAGTMFEPEANYEQELEAIAKKAALAPASIGIVAADEHESDEMQQVDESKADSETIENKKPKKGPPTLTVVK